MNIDHLKYVYFIGIGGIGMSALARYFKHLGCEVAGYDRTETTLTRRLVEEGISVIYVDDTTQIDPNFMNVDPEHLVVWTPAIPQDLSILKIFLERGVDLHKRSEVLGLISRDRYTIAVAGTHGKTTTSSMIAHILTDTGYGCSAFLGGITTNYNSNLLIGTNNVMVVEADEYDRSFLTLHPDIAVVTSADADHLDIFGSKEQLQDSFRAFLSQVSPDGHKIIRKGLPFEADTPYSAGDKGSAYGDQILIENEQFYFDYHDEFGTIERIALGIPGKHNIENAVAAIKVARILGIEDPLIKQSLANFRGVKRRFEYVVRELEHVYIDDYAHHPQELRALLTAVSALYPTRPLTLVFQPHLYSRTRDFMEAFSDVLSLADELILMPIYPARELPIDGITSDILLAKCQNSTKMLMDEQQVISYVSKANPRLLVTAGAGNIDRLVQPLKEILHEV